MCPNCAKDQHSIVCKEAFQKYDINFVKDWLLDHNFDFVDINEYTNAASSFRYKCLKCGHVGTGNFGNLLSGRQCRGCSGYLKRDTESFKEIVSEIDSDYEFVGQYITCKDEIQIKHKKCGRIYTTTPDYFINGSRCHYCNESKGEKAITKYLNLYNITYFSQFRFKDCRNIKPLPFDFYLPQFNMCIEYQGELHYKSINYFGGDKTFEYRKNNDKIKKIYCKKNNIKLLEIPYWDFENIGGIISAIN